MAIGRAVLLRGQGGAAAPPYRKAVAARRALPEFHFFTLAAAGADEGDAEFAGGFIEVGHELEPVALALEAFHVEPAERAVGRRARRFVILAPDKPSCRIHAPTLRPEVGHWWGQWSE